MNPIWSQMIYKAVKETMKVCTHCKKASTYKLKKPGRYYTCSFCGHRFQEKAK